AMPGPRKSSGSGGSRKSTSSPKKKPKMMTSGDENEMIDGFSSSESASPPTTAKRATRSTGGADKTPQATPLEVNIVKSPSSIHARGPSPSGSGKEYYHSYSMDLMHNKKVYRAPFKVLLMSWNPKMDLLALVSEKGEVCLKRQGWKTTWKMNVNTEERVVHEFPVKSKEKKGCPSCIEWSPDGMALVIGMTTGVYHIIDAEAGMLRFTWSLGGSIAKMSWRSLTEKLSEGWGGPSKLDSEDGAAMAEVAESTDERVQAAVEKALELDRTMMPRSLYQTVLTVVMEDLSIVVLLGGVLCVARLNFDDFMMNTYGVSVLEIMDATIDAKNDHELIVMYSGGAGTVPVRTGTTYGSWKVKKDAGRPADEAAPSSLERHNHVIGIELSVFRLLSERLWMLAARFVRMSITVFELTEMYDVIHKYWETESTKVVNRFAGCGFSMGEALISQILAGVSSDLMHEWVGQKMGAEGAHALREFYEKHLLELVENLRSSMLTASSALSNQMARWEDEAKLLFEEIVDPLQLLLGESCSLSTRPLSSDRRKGEEEEPFTLHDAFFKSMDRTSMQQLCTVVRQMVNVAEINGYEIAQLSRWLSLLGPILKASKKQVNIVRTCRKFYVPELMKYIVSTFVDEDKRGAFEELLFQLEGMAENEEEIEDEMSALSLALPSSMEGDAWYEQAKEKKPLPYDVLTRDRYFYRQSMINKRQKYRDQQQADLDARCRYIQLGMNCPAKRRDPVKAEKQAKMQAAQAAGPAANTRSHRASLSAVPTGPESGHKRRESRMANFASTPEAVRQKLRQLAKSYVASKGQYPTMKKTNGEEAFEIDKVSHYFRAGTTLPVSVQKMLCGDSVCGHPPLSLVSLPDAISACVKSVAGVYSSISGASKNPFTVRWCNELLSAERNVSLEMGRMERWSFAADSTRDWAEKQVKLDLMMQSMSNTLCVTGWNGEGIWARTLFSPKEETSETIRGKLQWVWRIRKEGASILSVRPSNPRHGTPLSSPSRPASQTRQAMADCTPSLETTHQGGGGAPLQPLTIQMEEDSSHSFVDHGEPIEIKRVFPMKSGTVMAVVVFENEQGKRQRLVQLNPYMDYRVFVHEDVLRSEIYEQWSMCREREMGAALSEGGTRVTWFEMKEK
ncbi:hypothetical protein PMAYCL1PPCAC_12862, partial [Pristionchus mayeri]